MQFDATLVWAIWIKFIVSTLAYSYNTYYLYLMRSHGVLLIMKHEFISCLSCNNFSISTPECSFVIKFYFIRFFAQWHALILFTTIDANSVSWIFFFQFTHTTFFVKEKKIQKFRIYLSCILCIYMCVRCNIFTIYNHL